MIGCPGIGPESDPETYTIIYDGNGHDGGTVPTDSTNYEEGSTVTLPSGTGGITLTGYILTGWNTISDGTGTDYNAGSTFTMGTADVIMYAQWTTHQTYTVTYYGNGSDGGVVPTDSNNYEEGAEVTTAAGTMTLTGYAFTGWNTAADGSGTARTAGSTFAMEIVNVLLYAQWTQNSTYTVTYYGNGSDGGVVPTDSNNYEEGTEVTAAAGTMTQAGYTFTGWNTSADGSGTARAAGSIFTMGTVSVSLHAQWVVIYTVTYDNNGAGSGMVPVDSNDYEAGETVTVPGNTGNLVKTGYIFTGWNRLVNGSGTNYTEGEAFLIGSSDVTLFAKWTENNYTITFIKNDIEATGTMADQEIGSGLAANLLENEFSKVGSTFSGWATTPGGSVEYEDQVSFTMGDSNIFIYAKWIANYNITFDKNDVDATEIMNDQTIASGSTVSLATNEFIKIGWTFEGWAITSDGSVIYTDGTSYTMGGADVTLYAKWTPIPTYSLRDIGPAGGWIFYDKGSWSDGWRYLEAAPANHTSSIWGTYGYNLAGAEGTSLGSGQQNTLDIIAGDPAINKAADECASYNIVNNSVNYDDWFLPSYGELMTMYNNLIQEGVGDFPDDHYWSSSIAINTGTYNYARFMRSASGTWAIQGRSALLVFRAIRAF